MNNSDYSIIFGGTSFLVKECSPSGFASILTPLGVKIEHYCNDIVFTSFTQNKGTLILRFDFRYGRYIEFHSSRRFVSADSLPHKYYCEFTLTDISNVGANSLVMKIMRDIFCLD